VKNLILATAVTAALSQAPVGAYAATADELTQIRDQLQGLMQRVDKLEQENTALKTENDSLKAQGDYLKAETRGLRKDSAVTAADTAKVKGADWAGRIALKGDLRYRYEYISDQALTGAAPGVTAADRYRDRIRLRFNAEAKATDTLTVGLGLATAENGDPRSSNQTLTGQFSRKPIELDLAYFDWKFANWGNFIGGKMKQPFYKLPQSAFWDNDINPEGLALTFNRGIWFGSLYNYWLTEISGAETAVTADTSMAGAQLGVRLPFGAASNLVLAAHYYDLSAAQGRAPFHPATGTGGNTTRNIGTPPNVTAVLVNDYEVINLSAELNTVIGGLPLQIFADAAQNQDPSDLDQAWAAGMMFGKASNPQTWEFGAAYQVIEKDALFAQLIDSDFAGGTTDAEGWALRAGFAPTRNWAINATYFLNKRNKDVATSLGQTETDYDRLQMDFNVKF
jgi:hypothetical protein